jgi:hypothetical protein
LFALLKEAHECDTKVILRICWDKVYFCM